MVPGPPKSPFGQLLEDRLSSLPGEADALFIESREQAHREFADRLNQAVRRLRMAPDADELRRTLLDAAAQFSTGAALFRIVHDSAHDTALPERIRGVPEAAAEAFATLQIQLPAAAALASAIESRDPVTAVTTPGEVSAELIQVLNHPPTGRVFVYPVVVRERVPALIYAWGEAGGSVQGSAIELLTQVAAAVWSAIPEPLPPPDLVSILPAASSVAKPTAGLVADHQPGPVESWDSLPAGEQQIHLRAQRFARVHVAEMRLFEADAVQSGRAQRSLYEALRKPIDAARETFRTTFFDSCASMVDYLDLELTRTLANDDPDLLGKTYPGPLVQ
jgi:hypothetical protein